jgi:methyltransferase
MSNQAYTIFCLFFLLIFGLERIWWTYIRKSKKENGIVKHPWTLYIMTISYFMIVFMAITEYFLVERIKYWIISLFGLVIFIISYKLRQKSVNVLKKYQSLNIEIREDHQFINNGPYKYMRHPWYLAIILELISLALIFNAYWTLFYILFIHIGIIRIRIFFEEKSLIEKFGLVYLKYRNERWALLPFLKISLIKQKK